MYTSACTYRNLKVIFPRLCGRWLQLYETFILSQKMLCEDLPFSEPVVGSFTLATNR